MSTDQILIPERVAGWVLGVLVAMIAALLLWPIERRTGLLQATADLAGSLASVVAELADPDSARHRLGATRAQIASLQAHLSTPLRPYGPAARDIAFVQLILHLEHATELTALAIDDEDTAGRDAELGSAVVAALERARDVLSGGTDSAAMTVGLERLDAARAATRKRLETDASRHSRQGSPALHGLRNALPLLALSHVVMWIEDEVARVKGLHTGDRPDLSTAPELSQRFNEGIRSVASRAGAFARLELDPEGVIFRNSIRAGVALATAVVLAELLPLGHGFWIVLGALCVLRSGASSTYTSALEAVTGTVAGFAIAALLVTSIGDQQDVLWILFPVAVALAAYSPGAIHFAVGQAAFTVMVVILFTLLDSPGLETAVVRVETVTIGALTAAALSLILWPRGARAALGHAVARVYRAASAGAQTFVSGSGLERERAAADLTGAWRGAEAAFSAALAEHKESIDTGAWVSILQPPTLVRSLISGLVPDVIDPVVGCRPAIAALEHGARVVADRLAGVGAELERASAEGTSPPLTAPASDETDAELERCIAVSADGDGMLQAMSLVGWSAWLDQLATSLERAGPAVQHVAAASTPHAWLHGRSGRR
jgi:uncharacterized membrane protein YccC